MAVRTRRDGERTRQRILSSALQVFAEKGFHDATHAEICRLAGANTAAVNYHFGSKDELYRATWESAADEVQRLHPIDGGVPSSAPAAPRLRGAVRALLQRATDARLGSFHRLLMAELFRPTGLLAESLNRRRRMFLSHMSGIIRELAGPATNERGLELCLMSVMSQCHMVLRGAHAGGHRPPWRFGAEDVDSLVDHITRFSLAGIAEVRVRGAHAGQRSAERV